MIKTLRRLPTLLFLLAGCLTVYYGYVYITLPNNEEAASVPMDELSWAQPQVPEDDAWSVFYNENSESGESVSSLEKRFRLAGTFFLTEVGQGPGVRKAVLDDLEKKRQYLVTEGDVVEELEVKEVHKDHVVLLVQGNEEKLWLSFTGSSKRGGAGEPVAGKPEKELRWDERVLESNHWGNRIAENRWVLKRDEIMRYYREVMDDPERLAALFVSMRAVRSEKQNNKITGYRLGMIGEEDFYLGVGMKEGDIVRKVNSMKMTRQERAEYFIKEFVQNRVNVLVLDIERDGEEQQLIYYLR